MFYVAGRAIGAALIAAVAAGPLFMFFWGIGHAALEFIRPVCRVCSAMTGFMEPFPEDPVSDLIAAIFETIVLAPIAIMFSVTLATLPSLIVLAALAGIGSRARVVTRRIVWTCAGLLAGAPLGWPLSHSLQGGPWLHIHYLSALSGALTGAACAAVANRLFYSRPASPSGS